MEKKRCYGCMREKTQRVCEYCGYDENTTNASHQLPAGTVLDEHYLIGRVLGQGGFGITYLGWDMNLDMPVAIKEYFPNGTVMRDTTYSLNVTSTEGDEGSRFHHNRERFLREAKALARFDRIPQVVHVLSFFLQNNTAYIVMEYVEGITLRQYVKNSGGKLGVGETLTLLRPVMEALDRVHQTGLVHRDISPDNIMLLPQGGAKLIDFGAVRDVQHADAEQPLTKSTEAILKHGYAPIEQYQRRGSLGPWTDVYALCGTIYYCLTGQVPPDAPERMMAESDVDWDRLEGLTQQQMDALKQGMALMPKDRTESAAELCRGLFTEPITEPEDEPEPITEPEDKPELAIEPKQEQKTAPKPEAEPKPKPAPAPKPAAEPKPVPQEQEAEQEEGVSKGRIALIAILTVVAIVLCVIFFRGKNPVEPAKETDAAVSEEIVPDETVPEETVQEETKPEETIQEETVSEITWHSTSKGSTFEAYMDEELVVMVADDWEFDFCAIRIGEDWQCTFTLSNLSLRDTYLTNLSASWNGGMEYCWMVNLGSLISVGTSYWANSSENIRAITIDEMQSNVWTRDGSYGNYLVEASVFYTEDQITWEFLLQDYDLSFFSDIKVIEIEIRDAYLETLEQRVYALGGWYDFGE